MRSIHRLVTGGFVLLLLVATSSSLTLDQFMPTVVAASLAAAVIATFAVIRRLAPKPVTIRSQQARRRQASVPLLLDSAPIADGHVRPRAPGHTHPRA